jgi:hypothetical protein
MFSSLRPGFLVAVAAMLVACNETTFIDVSDKLGYRELVGTTYTVVGPLVAYGIRKHTEATAEYVTLIPAPGIAGSEVGFSTPIGIGTQMRVIRVYETNRLIDSSTSLEVRLSGNFVFGNLPVRLDLMRGNQGSSKLTLNPAVFRKN